MTPSSYKQLYDEQGFVIIPSLIPADSFRDLTAAAERAINRTRSGTWSQRRTVGRQFPPFDDDHPDSWGVQHIMHPDLAEPSFAQWYTSNSLIAVAKDLLICEEEELQMGKHRTLYFCCQGLVKIILIAYRTLQHADKPLVSRICLEVASR